MLVHGVDAGVCSSECGVRFTDIPWRMWEKIDEVEDGLDEPTQPVQPTPANRFGRPQLSTRLTTQEREWWTDRLQRGRNQAMTRLQKKAREASDIFKFRRVHISISEAMDISLARSLYHITMPSPDTPLKRAIYSSNFVLARLLIEDSGIIKERNDIGSTALHHTIRFNQCKQPELQMAMREKEGELQLHSSCEEIVEEAEVLLYTTLAEWKAKVELAVERGNRGAMVSLLQGGEKMISQLDQGEEEVDLRLRSWFGEKAQMEAKEFIMASCVEIVSKVGFAWDSGIRHMTQLLFTSSANLETVNEAGLTMLHRAVGCRHYEILQVLLGSGANIEGVRPDGWRALHIASRNGDVQMMQLLLVSGAEIEAVCKTGFTPLHVAIEHGKANSVQLLLASGAQVEHVSKDGWSPLHFAVRNGQKSVMELLLSHGASIMAVGPRRITLLHCAIFDDSLTAVHWVLANGVDIEALTTRGITALVIAVVKGLSHMVELLLASGAKTEAAAHEMTELQVAVAGGHQQIAKMLLASGANIHAVGKIGCTALTIASVLGHEQIVQLLRENEAMIKEA